MSLPGPKLFESGLENRGPEIMQLALSEVDGSVSNNIFLIELLVVNLVILQNLHLQSKLFGFF